ncbi:Aste57867_1056 [Aphanomyces stellatus]|uniref:Aste57867_1056 protein n=1 Tax=Aphanomyces stellatus TaxID=120398 RepID=A0A485K4G6_9STRA|nr:hypothetical protein As57867_001055 [Aphanomyces stellatus]VFT78278.1 Aste57867_1056 [Aphanomyces stellatus]
MAAEEPKKSRRPEDTPFKQQTVPSWQPIFTPMWVISMLFVLGIVFLPIGIVLYTQSRIVRLVSLSLLPLTGMQPVEMAVQYDGVAFDSGRQTHGAQVLPLGNASCTLPTKADGHKFDLDKHGCIISFTAQEDMPGPILVMYELDTFYQNFKHYVKDMSTDQLRGRDDPNLDDCHAFTDVTSTKFNSTAPAQDYNLNPCGLIANTLFNDIYWVHSVTDANRTYYQTDVYNNGVDVLNLLDQSNIAWHSDLKNRFENYHALDPNDMYLWENPKYGWIIPSHVGQAPIPNKTSWTKPASRYGVQSERFAVWMRQAGLPYFRKLYGRLNMDLKAGMTVRFLVSSSTFLLADFPITHVKGRKALVLTTYTWLGGRNPFLGVSYTIVGGICLILSFLFFGKHKLSPRQLGDANYLVWQGAKN